MRIDFHAPFSVNDYTRNLVLEKLEKLKDLNLRISEADIYFKLKDGPDSQKDKELEIKLHVPGHVFFAKSYAETYEKAIPKASDKMRKQLIKYKKSLEPKRGSKPVPSDD